jgi:hypothetical protein
MTSFLVTLRWQRIICRDLERIAKASRPLEIFPVRLSTPPDLSREEVIILSLGIKMVIFMK